MNVAKYSKENSLEMDKNSPKKISLLKKTPSENNFWNELNERNAMDLLGITATRPPIDLNQGISIILDSYMDNIIDYIRAIQHLENVPEEYKIDLNALRANVEKPKF